MVAEMEWPRPPDGGRGFVVACRPLSSSSGTACRLPSNRLQQNQVGVFDRYAPHWNLASPCWSSRLRLQSISSSGSSSLAQETHRDGFGIKSGFISFPSSS